MIAKLSRLRAPDLKGHLVPIRKENAARQTCFAPGESNKYELLRLFTHQS